MEEPKTESVAAQTEVPVSSVGPVTPLTGKRTTLPKMDKKVLIGIGAVIVILIIGGISLFTINKNSKNQNAPLISKEYEEAYNSGNYKKAEEIGKVALSKDPSNPQINSGVVSAISAEGNQTGQEQEALKKSQSYINEALKTGGEELSVLISTGYAYETAGDYNKALEYYKKATELFPQSSEAWFHFAHVNNFLGNTKNANDFYNKSFDLNPSNPQVLIERGNNLTNQGKLNDAYNSYIAASKTPGIDAYTKAEALTAASESKMAQFNITDALNISKQALEINPTYSPALAARGFQLSLNNNRPEGISLLKQSIQANPKITKNYMRLAQVLRADGQFPEAIKVLEDAISKIPDDNTIVNPQDVKLRQGMYTYELAKTYSMSGASNDLTSMLNTAMSENPNVLPILKRDYEKNGFFSNQVQYPSFNQIINS